MSDFATDVELRPVETIIPYTNNPKEHPETQVQRIASSIKNYGWDQPIVVDGEGEIIKGHGRLQAAKLLGLEEVPVVERGELSDAEARAARIADNKASESGWHDDLLTSELEQLTDEFDAEALGFDDEGDIDDILGELEPDVPEEFDEVAPEDIETEHECPQCGYEW